MEFGIYLKKIRKLASLSAVALSEKLGVTTAYISRIETGIATPPGYDVCETIANILKLDDNQRKTLFVLAVKGRVASTNSDFLEEIGDPIYSNIDCAKIPVIDMPTDHVVFPIPANLISSYSYTNELTPSPYLFGLTNQYLIFENLAVSKPDIVIFEAYNHYLNSGDVVLVKIEDEFLIKQITYLNDDTLIKFSPESETSIYPKDSDSYSIIGKMTLMIKKT